MDKIKINKGHKISKTFPGGVYEELMHLRKAVFSMYVLQNQTDFTQQEIDNANIVVQEMLTLNNTVEEMRLNT